MKEEIRKRVCIIGAGVTGLAAIHRVTQSPGLVGTVFEQSPDIGGIWVYKSKTGNHGALYKNMRTNLPIHVMRFCDYPETFPTKSFVHHTDVLKFLNSYERHFGLRKYIQFHRRVVNIRPISSQSGQSCTNPSTPKWHVTVQDTNTNSMEEFEFDAILVCNGHLSKPRVSDIPNIDEFRGTALHSKDYDDATPFVGKKVVIVGYGPSGQDIGQEIAEVASQVFISSIKNKLNLLPANVKQISKIQSATREGFLCENGENISCDAIIMCTGFYLDFPFLSPECRVIVEKGHRISPLYRDLVHVKFTNLCFVGIQCSVTPFVLVDFQSQYCVRLFQGLFDLPSEESMLEELANHRRFMDSLNLPFRRSHELGTRQWEYYEILANEAGFPVPAFLPLVQKIYDKIQEKRPQRPRYKNDRIYITDLDTHSFEYIEYPENPEIHPELS